MIGNASALFRATFAVAPRVVASAPGRVNLLGEHTDYNGGPVLPIAIAARTTVAAGAADAGILELISTRDGQMQRIDYRSAGVSGPGAYVAGVMRELAAAGAGPPCRGARVAIASDVPVGAGLAASAAVTGGGGRAPGLLGGGRPPARQPGGGGVPAGHGPGGGGGGVMGQGRR